ncbi:hypothetical protein DQ04_02351040 [Trypanosoma grayi]|uniref:hypothetical protein n=1 Tax=Trypanosoma grayi TaxID=71804 RepID=UPI0004F47AA0|nr:hypothetical protein DQ04_02351040 [Trypanosoma grayi]KEG11708.1 hypothetical protein DQ04_02351040 [Trypanosoma grayi]
MAIVEGVTSVDDTDDTGARGKKPRKKKLKSKRAATTLSLEEIVASMSTEKIFEYLCVDMEVESASYDLRVGDNDGYAYRVKLRRIPESHLPLVKPAMRSLEEKGFINYFGPQRFASYTKHNMHPGLHLLKGEYRAAASIIVQQFALDAEIAAERRRTGAAFAKMYHSKAMGFHLPDRSISHRNRRSIAAHGTALQSILDNALRAASMLGEDEEDGVAGVAEVDPCEEAFLRVVGPKACSMLVHEFLAFVWNDIVNQRLQRYGTFAILPGDLVRQNPLASPHSAEYGRVKYATKKGIDRSDYNFWDVVLPLPGVGVQLPENHTTDLYIVTLKRMGILFNPETRQWDIFRPRRSFSGEDAAAHSTMAASPYRRFSSSFALMEEELGSSTTMVETIDGRDNDVAEEVGSLADVGHLRSDLRRGVTPGNPLGVNIYGFYRHLLINPLPTLTWRVRVGHSGDPHQRWALGVRRAFTRNSSSSSSSISNSVHGTPVGTNSSNGQQQQQPSLLLGRSTLTKGERRQRTAPPVPYWLPQKSDVSVDLSFELPSSVYPSMLLREITKSDVNSPETVDLDRPLLDTRAKSWHDLTADQQATYRRHLAQKRQKMFTSRPRAMNVALLHQHIFRNGGMRRGLLPSMRGYDNVSK